MKPGWDVFKRASRITAAAGLSCLIAALGSGIASAADTDPGPAPAAADETHALSLRKEFGLKAELDYVRSVGVARDKNISALGIPLTPAEAANIKARDVLVGVATRISAGATKLSGYGDVWIDQAAGGVLRVGLVGGQGSPAAAKIREIAGSTPVAINTVKHDLSTLTSTQDALTSRMSTDPGFRAQIVQVAMRPQLNGITVAVRAGGPQSLVDSLRAQYGDQLRLETQSDGFQLQAGRDIITGPLYGGEWTGGCTVGYSYAIAGGYRYMITAGHCSGGGSGHFYRGKSNQGTYIGDAYANGYVPGGSSYCDCKVVGRLTSDLLTNKVLVAKADPAFTYTRTGTSSNYTIGQPVCMSGAAYADSHSGNIACGTISGNGTMTSNASGLGFTLYDAAFTNIRGTVPGDSGAPYGNGGSFLGIHSAIKTDGTETAMSKAKYITGMGNSGRDGLVSLDY